MMSSEERAFSAENNSGYLLKKSIYRTFVSEKTRVAIFT